MGVGTPVLVAAYQSFLLGTAIQDADSRARLAMERMLRELRTASLESLPSPRTATTLTFRDQDDLQITYTFSGGQLTRNGIVLAQNVTAGTFTVATSPAPLVNIDLTITTSGQGIRLLSGVVPRNPWR
ncbi:MAG: hypothetical protein HQL60_05245 [Magnetococcales bacterium]|nr:hypothetical protein [Magnetococcales bacterium]